MTADAAAGPAPLPKRERTGFLKRFLPRTLFGRSLVIIVTPVILAQAVATWIFYDRHWDTMTNRLAFAVAGDIAMVISVLEHDPTPEGRNWMLANTARSTDLIVTLEPGNTLPEQRPQLRGLLERTLGKALDERVHRPFAINTRVAHEWYEIRVQMPDGVLSVMSPERRLFSPTSYIFILWMVGSALVLFTVAIIFMRNQIRPIKRLAAAADALGKGRDVANFKPEGATEVRQAAAAFLKMRERIHRQITQRTEMLAGVSHDLRTPLTRMKLALDMLGDGPEVEELMTDVAEMETMIEGYLAFARGEGTEAVAPTDLTRILNETVAGARREGAEVLLETEADMTLPLRPNAMRRCLANLLSNARRHGARIWVQAERRGASIEILVDDDGPGIPKGSREDVFKPFFRLDSSRNQATGGAGLGLTIARDVVRSHGGDVTLSDSPHGGLRVLIRLPV
ncbi:ATP-binding protein [Azospirillum rugosum]|uniref:histidine kinase n=1 Tax=Azospirillum rugosum TaxID=416170 RepID=A0ABS4ST19_9PROT|nr:ATP-binding protein [Azospirillum rugosum]MBP2294520.1 two-component system osmolarity sensor histidine kinase EnvZ [Azospirillum rugosum]MDQ0529025.1 two-component system osmolarity sensor histidine kinase EnvZ [Azospirillum rugosum]